MYNNIIYDRVIPRQPKKQTDVIEKFTTVLNFPEKNGLRLSEWVNDDELVAHMGKLTAEEPDRCETYCLAYFLDILRNKDEKNELRDLARKHLWSFYQASIYWTTQRFWSNFNSKTDLWEWEELFDRAGETLTTIDIDKTVHILRKFDPRLSTKTYVEKIFYRSLTNWKDIKLGRNSVITHTTLDVGSNIFESEDWSSYKEKQIEEAMIENTSVREEKYKSKQEQNRVLLTIESELDKVEESSATDAPIGNTNVTLWVVLLFNYGLKLNQSGTAELLTLNQQSISQPTINRRIKNFVIYLQQKLIAEFREEIQEGLGDLLKDEEPIEKTLHFLEWTTKKQAELESLLKDCINERIFNCVVKERGLMLQNGNIEELLARIRGELEKWSDENWQISLHATILSEKLEIKVHKIVLDWVDNII